jgi:hypothetical protein
LKIRTQLHEVSGVTTKRTFIRHLPPPCGHHPAIEHSEIDVASLRLIIEVIDIYCSNSGQTKPLRLVISSDMSGK